MRYFVGVAAWMERGVVPVRGCTGSCSENGCVFMVEVLTRVEKINRLVFSHLMCGKQA